MWLMVIIDQQQLPERVMNIEVKTNSIMGVNRIIIFWLSYFLTAK